MSAVVDREFVSCFLLSHTQATACDVHDASGPGDVAAFCVLLPWRHKKCRHAHCRPQVVLLLPTVALFDASTNILHPADAVHCRAVTIMAGKAEEPPTSDVEMAEAAGSDSSDSDSDFEEVDISPEDTKLLMRLEQALQDNPNLYDSHVQASGAEGRRGATAAAGAAVALRQHALLSCHDPHLAVAAQRGFALPCACKDLHELQPLPPCILPSHSTLKYCGAAKWAPACERPGRPCTPPSP